MNDIETFTSLRLSALDRAYGLQLKLCGQGEQMVRIPTTPRSLPVFLWFRFMAFCMHQSPPRGLAKE